MRTMKDLCFALLIVIVMLSISFIFNSAISSYINIEPILVTYKDIENPDISIDMQKDKTISKLNTVVDNQEKIINNLNESLDVQGKTIKNLYDSVWKQEIIIRNLQEVIAKLEQVIKDLCKILGIDLDL